VNLTIPLAALRYRLNSPADTCYWQVHTADTPERALLQLAGAAAVFPLELDRPAALHGRVRLLGRDWRDGNAAIAAHVSVAFADRSEREVWSQTVGSAAVLGYPEGIEFHCEIPAETVLMRLWIEHHRPVDDRSVGRALWVEPGLTVAVTSPPMAPQPPKAPQPPTGAAPAHAPLISVLMPVHNPPPHMLEAAIDSVQLQTYGNWELVLVDDGSTNPAVINALARRAAEEERITLYRRDVGGGISSATNAALERASGEYVALLDHDDTLTADALQRIVETLIRDPGLDMLYSDEAVISDDGEATTVVKPGWSPDAIHALMYTCHVGVYRRSLAEDIGAFNAEYDGCQDYDFVLRVMEHTDRVAHIPGVLYHWRAHAESTAGGDQAKPYAYVKQPRAISAHLARTGAGETNVDFGERPGLHRVVYRADPNATVETIVGSGPDSVADLAEAASASSADFLVLSWTALVGLTHDWLDRLLGYASQPGVAAASPIVLSTDGRILHAGVALPDGIPLHLLHAAPAPAAPPVVSNVAAVDGVLAMRRSVYTELGGLDPTQGGLAMIDLCLRATQLGLRCVTVPDARVQSTGDPAANDLIRIGALAVRRQAQGLQDRFYNTTGYRSDRGDFTRR
jgi:GT2 family glycosyltransferase